MKRCLFILVALYSLHGWVYGQSPSAAIDKLIKYKIITAKQRPLLERQVRKKGRASYRVAILGALQRIMLQKMFHVNPYKTGVYVSFNGKSLDKKSRDSINNSLRVLLEKIKTAGLLTNRVYTYTLNEVNNGGYLAEVQLIGGLREMSSRLEWLTPNRVLPVAEQLHKNGIVSDTAFVRLTSDIRNRKIESTFQLNEYCLLDRTFNATAYADDPSVWLEQHHRDIASMLPGLSFTNFTYTTVPDTSFTFGGNPGIKFKISLKCNGRIYKYATPVLNYRNGHDTIRFSDVFPGSFYRIFNKVLADEQSPMRLHYVMLSSAYSRESILDQCTLIALRPEQAQVFRREPCMSLMMTSMETFDNTLTSARIDSAITQWRTIGLFAHLSDAEISKGIDNAETDDLFSIDKLLTNFSGVLYSLDSAVMSRRPTYVNLLDHLAKITHGVFNPTEIIQTKVNSGVKLQYTCNGKIHSYMFNTANGWLDAHFIKFMSGLGKENNLPGNFYQLPYEPAIIYLSNQQYNYTLKHKLLDWH